MAQALALASALAVGAAQARPVALLVGVGQYGAAVPALEGPPHDVAALRDVLVRRWGFAAQDVRTLVDRQATRAAILTELKALQARSAPGDEVFVYFSGHGTSALDGVAGVPLPHGSGAFVPWDVDLSSPARMRASMIVGRTDLRPLIEALEAGGRRLWVVSDSCFSGQQVRSLAPPAAGTLPSRMIPMPAADEPAAAPREPAGGAVEPYPYRATAYLAASAEGERAVDVPAAALASMPTIDGRPHGALTDALLRVLEGRLGADLDRNGLLDLTEVHRAVSDFMAQRAYGHTPQRLPAVLDDAAGLGARPVLSQRGVVAAPAQAAPEPLRVAARELPEPWRRAVAAVRGVEPAGAAGFDLRLLPRAGGIEVLLPSGDRLAMPDTPARLQAQLVQLAWAKGLRQLAEQHRRAALPVEVTPAEYGGNLRIGQRIQFVVRPDRAAWVVLVNINADGRVSVLYPFSAAETRPLAGNQAHRLPPGAPIEVRPPTGMDLQLVFAFDAPPQGLERLVGIVDADPGDPRLLALQRWPAEMAGRFGFAPTELRVSEARR